MGRERKMVYIIRWIKSDKIGYSFGKFLSLSEGKLMPGPMQETTNLKIALRLLSQERCDGEKLTILLLGFIDADLIVLSNYLNLISCPYILKHIDKPIGLKPDGTSSRILLINHSTELVKDIKSVLINAHFEIYNMIRDPNLALSFFKVNYRKIDLLITGFDQNPQNIYQVVSEMKNIKANLQILAVASPYSSIDYRKMKEVEINNLIFTPIVDEEFSSILDDIQKTNYSAVQV